MANNFNDESGRVFISGKMRGMEEREWRKRFERAELDLILSGWHPENVVNPAKLSLIYPNLSRAAYMQIDLKLLEECGTIYLLDNWKESQGAKMEMDKAQQLNLTILFEGETE